MKVIGAGLPRTATTTQAIAFETLGFGHCYHMRDLLMDMESGLGVWEAAARGEPDWEGIFADAQSTVDWPGGRYYKELLDYYPDSKVVLSVRAPECTGLTSAPSIFMRKTLGFCRSTSTSPM